METRVAMSRTEIEDLMKTIDDTSEIEDMGDPEEEVIIDAEGSEQADNKNKGTVV